MSTTASQRVHLHDAARRLLGETEGDILMALLPPADAELATKQHVDSVRTELRQDMSDLRAELRADMASLEQRLGERIHRAQIWTAGLLLTTVLAGQGVTIGFLHLMLR